MLDFGSLKTPPHDGDILIEPCGEKLRAGVEINRSTVREYHFRLGGVDLADVRRATQKALAGGGDKPCIVTGHQCEFMHAGVWAKYVATDRLARTLGGIAIGLAVDNDAPKKTSFSVPVAKGKDIRVHEVRYSSAAAGMPFEAIEALNEKEKRRLTENLRDLLGEGFEATLLPTFLAGLEEAEASGDLAEQLIAGRKAIDAAYDVDLIDHRISAVWGGPFLAGLLLDAGNFAVAYNRALREYRRAEHIRGSNRPIADLVIEGNRIELPLWTFRPGEVRRRVFVEIAGDRRTVFAEDHRIGTVSVSALTRVEVTARGEVDGLCQSLRPKALALTLWARLLLADLFIHGIGGAKYDRITDRILQDYYGVRLPIMGCVSATLHLDLPASSVTLADLRDADRRARDIRYNPQRYVTDKPGLEDLARARASHIARSNELRARRPGDHGARREMFEAIRESNQRLLALDPALEPGLVRSVEEARRAVAQYRVARSREYFVGLFGAAKLGALADRIRAAI